MHPALLAALPGYLARFSIIARDCHQKICIRSIIKRDGWPEPRHLTSSATPTPEVCYVDAADYPGRRAAVAAVLNQQGNTVASCSVTEVNPEIGEEVAIALAVAGTSATTIISDSKTALRNYS
ncbi:hypothetical protein HPB48_006318 [Haemaphysalis longicornis]|uniref:Uncharacterized protein n=1 Tax=Haemaphysalis longicornis TaxID=44386 RepID=A0A9J6G694_HAELO|nr:hypothetical protein HPB48_006318 [Haemaphysalis longicornis]